MAFDAEPGGDPRGPWCKGCGQPIEKGQPSTFIHATRDPYGTLGLGGRYHGECARPFWDTITPLLRKLGGL